MKPRLEPVGRALGLALFRPHVENGLSVAAGIALLGMAAGLLLGITTAAAIGTGALCVSIVDQPGPLSEKPVFLSAAVVATTLATALVGVARSSPATMALAIALTGFAAGLMSAYGKRAIGLGVAMFLAFVFAMGTPASDLAALLQRLALVAIGAVFYALYAWVTALVFADRERRLLLAEAMRGFAAFLRAKADLFDPGKDATQAFRALIESHATLVDQLQTARDAMFGRHEGRYRTRRVDALIALLDAFEAVLSSDADIETLRRSSHHHLMRRMRALCTILAADVERLTLALRAPEQATAPSVHAQALKAIEEETKRLEHGAAGNDAETQVVVAFRATAEKLAQAAERIATLARVLDARETPRALARGLDLGPFMQGRIGGLAVLRAQMSIEAPALRYAIRFTLALLAGFALTVFVPKFAHGTWVLLTTALIMRANYSVTRRRRWDRVIGTLIGCALAAAIMYVLPLAWLFAIIVISIGVSHAYGAVNYRVTAVAASITALLLLHMLAPDTQPLVVERVVDTLTGAALSYIFSFFLPSWERRDLPKIVAGLIAADAAFAREALQRVPVEQTYRLARKRALDAVAALAGTIRRLADEPQAARDTLARLNDLLGANYLFASDIASVQVLLRRRAAEIAPDHAEALLAEAREAVLKTLPQTPPGTEAVGRISRKGLNEVPTTTALSILRRRLVHIEHAAKKVAQLAAKL